jgi:photosystem II stability/assembly factor-like uncharacterized protein
VTVDQPYLPHPIRRRFFVVPGAVALLAGVLAGCVPSEAETTDDAVVAVAAGQLPSTHIHGVGVDPADGTIFLATHDGLFAVDEDGASNRVGPVIDLMGFAVAGAGHFVASGHPGPGTDMPQPVGLIETTDGGRTWDEVSRQGESDFHALTVSEAGVLGYDGSLLRSSDGQEWEQVLIPAAPATLSASADGQLVLATTRQGLLRSADGGRTWSPVDGAPLLQVVHGATAGQTVVGADPSGVVWTSVDRGATWEKGPSLGSSPQAVHVSASDGSTRVVVVTAEALLESNDGGRNFDVLLGR